MPRCRFVAIALASLPQMLAGLALTVPARAQGPSEAARPHPAPQAAAEEQLAALLAEAWEFELDEDPLWATNVGDRRGNARLPRVGLDDVQRRFERRRAFRERLAAIDRGALGEVDRVHYDIFARLQDEALAAHGFGGHLMPITNRSGFHVDFPELPREIPLETAEDYENYLARLKAFERYAIEHIELMRAGLQAGLTLPAVVLEGYREPLERQLVDDPQQSLLFRPFTAFPASVPQAQRADLAARAREAIVQSVVPGYRRFLEFMRDEYVPGARGTIGCSALPEGRAYYRHLVRRHTTLDLTPEEVHALGLREVERIDGEMQQVLAEAGFSGSLDEFVAMLRSDARFYAQTRDELLKEVGYVLKRIDGQLPKLFGKLPRTPYGIREVPDYIAPQTTTAYYMPPAGDGTRAGFYYVNTYNLSTRPLFEIEALSLHEAVPGHHLQIALAQELTELPPFRRFAGFTAMVEGWGLYAERLGLEMGFYQDPYSNFGRLSYEAWRACRLVVDTGIHYLGWSREQAIEFMRQHTALALHNITTEVDRYISWPGQALAYKVGELKFRELRARAEAALAERFDVRQFHDVVLGAGSVPLDVLESNVDAYIARVQGS